MSISILNLILTFILIDNNFLHILFVKTEKNRMKIVEITRVRNSINNRVLGSVILILTLPKNLIIFFAVSRKG